MDGEPQVIEIRSSVDEIHRVQSAVSEQMTHHGFDADACFAVKLALEEAVVNAMKHGNKFESERTVRVWFRISDHEIDIRVKDEGVGFNPCCVPDPTADENLCKPNGRGIMLMRAYMDDVQYSACGTEVTMVKRKKD